MKRMLLALLITWTTTGSFQEQQMQVWSGRLSDNMCGASHQLKAAGKLSERECVFECIKVLAKYVLVPINDEKQQVIPILNQDFGGFPLYAGRAVKITGTLKDGAILATKVERLENAAK